MIHVFIYAIGFGVLSILMGYAFGFMLHPLIPVLNPTCKQWNRHNVMEIILFGVGIAFFAIFRYTSQTKP